MSDSAKPKTATPEEDAPKAPKVRECSDRIAKMERELQELRARFDKVSERSHRAAG